MGRIHRTARTARKLRWGVASAVVLAGLLMAAPARSDEYEPKRAGHPVRILAYIFHPVGVLLDYALFRPAHWLVEFEPLQTIFGHTD